MNRTLSESPNLPIKELLLFIGQLSLRMTVRINNTEDNKIFPYFSIIMLVDHKKNFFHKN